MNQAPFGIFNWTGRKFTAATTSENVQDKPAEGTDGDKITEAEKKLKADIETLNKELETLTQKAASFEVTALIHTKVIDHMSTFIC